MGPTRGQQDPGGPLVGHVNLAFWVVGRNPQYTLAGLQWLIPIERLDQGLILSMNELSKRQKSLSNTTVGRTVRNELTKQMHVGRDISIDIIVWADPLLS